MRPQLLLKRLRTWFSLSGNIGAKLRARASAAASRECLIFISTMIIWQLVCIVAHLTLVAAGRASVVPIVLLSATLLFHVPCAFCLAMDIRRKPLENGIRPSMWERCLDIATPGTLVFDTALLALSRADVQHWLHYRISFVGPFLGSGYLCEIAGDKFGEMAEDQCLLGHSQMIHTLALFWAIYFLLFVVSQRHLILSAFLSTVVYTSVSAVGVSSLHLEASEEYGSLFLYADLLWWVMILCTMVIARVRLDIAKHELLVQIESHSNQALSEKVLRCQAEFKNSHLEESMVPPTESSNSVYARSSDVEYVPLTPRTPRKSPPSAMSAPAMMCQDGIVKPLEFLTAGCPEGGDCLPKDSLVWIDGYPMPRSLDEVTAGQRVLCYDSLSYSVKYASIIDVGPTAKTEDRKWVAISLEDGTELQMTEDHPVQIYPASGDPDSCSPKMARDVTVARDAVMVMRTVPVPVRSVSAPQSAPPGCSFKVSVQQPDRFMIFVAKAGRGQANQVMAVGPSNLAQQVPPAQSLGKHISDKRSVASAPTRSMLAAMAAPMSNYDRVAKLTDFAKGPSYNQMILRDYGASQYGGNGQSTHDGGSVISMNESSTMGDGSGKDHRGRRRCEYWIATHLARLDTMDPDKVLKIKNIATLGFNSATPIRDSFSRFGTVDEVLLCRSQDETPQHISGYRHRPSRFCFVVMSTPEEAAAVLRNGEKQLVANTTVIVEKFKASAPMAGLGNNGYANGGYPDTHEGDDGYPNMEDPEDGGVNDPYGNDPRIDPHRVISAQSAQGVPSSKFWAQPQTAQGLGVQIRLEL